MKKIILAVVIVAGFIYFLSCSKANTVGYVSCTPVAVAGDSTALLAFAKADSITPVKDTSGMYYQIINQGTGNNPVGTSQITVTYVGKLLNGAIFDSTSSPRTFQLNGLIAGWQLGLPKIQPGGRIKLLIPSALAYGCQGSGAIAPNTPVYFDITLISVQ